ncbi:MAG: radical SAM protein [Desulfamplus sp.]|nr:radical SAM protein [Desulfamplus sp.]
MPHFYETELHQPMILIYPPVSKICEPPPGAAYLAGALARHNIGCKVIDANVDALLWLAHGRLDSEISHESNWTRRAISHLSRNLGAMKDIALYANRDRYRQRVMEINQVISTSLPKRYRISLSDYADAELSPLESRDILAAAQGYENNPFYPYFQSRLAGEIDSDSHANLAGKIDSPSHACPGGKTHSPSNDMKPGSDIVGISLCYLSQALNAFALAGWIRALFPEKRIVMGGGLVTSWMSSPDWRNPFTQFVDVMVKGPGEEALLTLALGTSGKHEGNLPCYDLSGPGSFVSPTPKNFSQHEIFLPDYYDSFLPDYHFCNWDSYLAPGPILPFRTSDGCYWRRCRFCPERAEGRPYRPQKNGDLLGALNILSQKHSLRYIHFIDDAIPPSFLRALAASGGIASHPARNESAGTGPAGNGSEFARNGSGPAGNGSGPAGNSSGPAGNGTGILTWYGFVRFTEELADPSFCRALHRAGCRMLKLGLESGDQAVLDRMEKGTDLATASRVLGALHGAGIRTYVYLLFGTQFEDESSARKTLDYVSRHSRFISFLNLAIFNLPRFSDDALRLETNNFYGGDLSLYLNFKHPLGWGRKEIRNFLNRYFKKGEGIASILNDDPPFFTSNHAMFTGSI